MMTSCNQSYYQARTLITLYEGLNDDTDNRLQLDKPVNNIIDYALSMIQVLTHTLIKWIRGGLNNTIVNMINQIK